MDSHLTLKSCSLGSLSSSRPVLRFSTSLLSAPGARLARNLLEILGPYSLQASSTSRALPARMTENSCSRRDWKSDRPRKSPSWDWDWRRWRTSPLRSPEEIWARRKGEKENFIF